MKKIKVLFVMFLVLVIFKSYLFSMIYSRVQGVVQDESATPINKAIVMLFTIEEGVKGIADQQETDTSGKFKFESITKGEYFLQVFKEGYAAYGPLMNYDRMINRSGDFPPVITTHSGHVSSFFLKNKSIDTFFMREGQIKHFVVRLKKEAVLILKVTTIGANVSKEFGFNFSHSAYSDQVRYRETGEYRSKCLGSGTVDAEVYPDAGFPSKTYSGVEIKSGQTTVLEYVLDFTKGQVIHGIVIDKETKKPAEVAVGITGIDTKLYVSTYSNKNGEYWIGGIDPGKFKISMSWYTSWTREYKYQTTINVAVNEKKEFNIEI